MTKCEDIPQFPLDHQHGTKKSNVWKNICCILRYNFMHCPTFYLATYRGFKKARKCVPLEPNSNCKLSFQFRQWVWGLAWVTVESPASQLECGWIGGRLREARNKVLLEWTGGWGVLGSAPHLAEVTRFDLNWVF